MTDDNTNSVTTDSASTKQKKSSQQNPAVLKVTGRTHAELLDAAKRYHANNIVTIPLKMIDYRWNDEKKKYKKIYYFCADYPTTTLDNCLQRFANPYTYAKDDEGRRTRKKNFFVPDGLAILYGSRSGLFGFDVDDVPTFTSWLDGKGQKLETALQHSGGNGLHYMFQYQPRLHIFDRSEQKLTIDGQSMDVDIRSGDKFALIAAPTRYQDATGQHVFEYRWEPDRSVFDKEAVRPVPDWFFETLVAGQGAKRPKKATKVIGKQKAGQTQAAGVDSSPIDVAAIGRFLYACFPDIVSTPGIVDRAEANANGYIYVGLSTTQCLFRDKAHATQHPYILMYHDHVVYRCHDSECRDKDDIKKPYPGVAEYPPPIAELRSRNLADSTFGDLEAHTEDAELGRLLEESLDGGSTTSLTRVAFYLLKGKVLCMHRDQWYDFQGHIWHPIAGAPGLRILSCLEGEYKKLVSRYEEWPVQTDAIRKKALMARKILHKKVLEGTWRNKCGDELAEMFELYAREHDILLDNRTFLKAFRNGVYDLETDTFRHGAPDDYLTKHLPYDLPSEDDSEKVAFLNARLQEIMPDPDQLRYLLFSLCTCLVQLNQEELIYIWKGIGRNGKGLLKDLMVLVLGLTIYCQTPQATLLTSARPNSHQASSNLQDISGMCANFLSEPDDGKQIKTALLRQITGNDKSRVRRNYGNEETFDPTATTILLCNDLPVCDSDVSAVWDRYRILVFVAYFCDNPDPNVPTQVKIDRTLKEKLPLYAPQFMRMLMAVYKEYRENGYTLPPQTPQMLKELKVAKGETNPVRVFVEECVKKTSKAADEMPIKTLKEVWDAWTDDHTMTTEKLSKRLVKLGFVRAATKKRFNNEKNAVHYLTGVQLTDYAADLIRDENAGAHRNDPAPAMFGLKRKTGHNDVTGAPKPAEQTADVVVHEPVYAFDHDAEAAILTAEEERQVAAALEASVTGSNDPVI
ncbi:hypothetical protein HK097_003498 [Rhizophlyctis rosea]|uniref:SF3 helicase domain-containing protein n=1 Tax=Rhizophlyctis rosea TaxID=64517 RepID=A0AAD5S3C4_9FUNG|nr:hypothetical protein HK097_003498 [Rhizophlyctis rosea]